MDERLRRLATHLRGKRNAAEFSPAAVDPDLLPHMFVLEIERCSCQMEMRIERCH